MESVKLSEKSPEGLYAPMQYIWELGGKRVRPLMALLAYRIYQPKGEIAAVAPVMRAVELFHNFSLLHDDVMDDAPLRRGRPTVYKKWGTNTAILSGDGMLIEAYQELAQLPAGLLPRALPIFNRMALGVCEGQQYDMDFEQKSLSELTLEDYLNMIRLKTSYLFQGSVMLGALVGGADDGEIAHLQMAAEEAGLAFQIKDDYLDAFPEKDFGKQRGGDILEKKKTWLLLKAYQKAGNELEEALAKSDTEERIELVTQIYQDTMTDERALQEVTRHSERAIYHLSQLSTPAERHLPLIELFEKLIGRKS